MTTLFHPFGSSIHRALKRLAWVLMPVLLLWGWAAVSVSAAPEATDEERLAITMRDAEISAVIEWIGEKMHKQIVVDPRVRGKITVLANEPMTVGEAYQVFLAALDMYGYSVSEQDGILRIYPAAMARVTPSEIVENFNALKGGEQIVYVYRASNLSALKLQQLITPLIPPTGYVQAFPDNNSLLIGDDATNVKRVLKLLRQVDTTGQVNIQALKLRYANAEKVAGLVESLVVTQGNESFAVASDQRSNSVLLSGDPATRQRVQQLIEQLDQPIETTGVTRVVYLNYLDAEEVVPILKGLSGSVQESDRDAKNQSVTVSIESSKSANAIVMTAPTPMLDLMEKVIKDIDIRRSQVLVEAIIVEVSRDFSETIGVEWNTNQANDDNIEALTSFGLKAGLAGAAPTDTISSILGAGLSLGYYRNGSLRALAQAIAKNSDANILSTPSILTLDNQEAEILVGSNVPFITGQVTSDSSSTANPFTTIERQDIGLSLKITPKVNEGNAVTLDVLQELESIAESTDIAKDIVTNKRSIKTKVLVEDGTILVLGGLISDEAQLIENKVPFLGDLPLLGTLFKSTTEKQIKKNLMVFIHPVIMDESGSSTRETREKYDYMKQLRERFGDNADTLSSSALEDFDTYQPRPQQEQPH